MVISKKQERYYWFIFALAIYCMLIQNWGIAYWDQDESAYAGFAHTFIESGNWVVPDFMWSEAHRKPPLHFWNIALSFKLFGVNEFATRIPSVLAIIGTLLLIKFMGKNLFGKAVADMAMIIASTSILVIALAKISVTDSTLLFFETLAVLSLFNFIQSKSLWYLLFFVLGIAGGTLTKGPPVLILTYGILGILFLFKTYRIQTLLLFFISLIGLLPIYLWGKMAWDSDGGVFISWMIDWYILKRGNGVFGQTGPPGYFLLIFLGGLFAFSSFLILGLKDRLSSFFNKEKRNETTIFLVAWLFGGWFVYELITSKLPAYAIGALPAVSILIADQIVNSKYISHSIKWQKFAKGTQLFFTFLIGMALLVAAFWFLNGMATILAIVAGLFSLGMGIYSFRIHNKSFLILCSLMLLPSVFAWTYIVPSVEDQRSTTKIAAKYIIEEYNPDQEVIFTRNFSLPSFPMYLATSHFHCKEIVYWELTKDCFANNEIIIFDEEGYTHFRKYTTDLSDAELKVHKIEGLVPDRGNSTHYYIVSSRQSK
ncbi:MAG: glycosyltransferase family 39 protein [Crocinitomicaceae bacterium]